VRFLGFAKMPRGFVLHPTKWTAGNILNTVGGKQGTSKTGLRLNGIAVSAAARQLQPAICGILTKRGAKIQ
jgi:hypothetical protein